MNIDSREFEPIVGHHYTMTFDDCCLTVTVSDVLMAVEGIVFTFKNGTAVEGWPYEIRDNG